MLEKTRLESERSKRVKELSGGNKRKLSLGMAIIGGSKIIFLDEPSSGLDVESRKALWEILESLKKEARTLLMTSHFIEEVDQLSDRIGIMASGKLLAVGTSAYIKKNFGVG